MKKRCASVEAKTMRIKSATAALAGLFIMTGCSSLVSLQPVVSEKEAITDPALPGTWTGDEGKDTYVVRESGGAYAITYVEKSGTAYKFNGRLWKCGDALLLDLVSTSEAPFHLPVHFAMRVWVESDSLRIAYLDSDWFKKLAAEQLTVQSVDDRMALTATPAAMRAFFLANASNEKAHGDPETLHRSVQ
jgi:hypothetical protein